MCSFVEMKGDEEEDNEKPVILNELENSPRFVFRQGTFILDRELTSGMWKGTIWDSIFRMYQFLKRGQSG